MPLAARIREALWPRKGFGRSVRYIGKRLLRIAATPHAVAAGVAAGVFATFTPFVGFHVLIALAVAWLLAGNLIAAALSTTIGNPLTFPFLWALTFRVGEAMLGIRPDTGGETVDLLHALEHLRFAELWQPVIKPMLAGGLLLGPVAAIPAYLATRYAVSSFRRRRAHRPRAVPSVDGN
ncbi:DUF2062 domain-containing protein [Rhizobium sp. TRM95111]|nr:DUF2062 domain-containing protein [Rhizobium alarense]MCF3641673.1 DUF2062 domain-containing protein [Rhizobium alarense]